MFRHGLKSSASLARRVLPQTALALGRQHLTVQITRTSLPVMRSGWAISKACRMYSTEAMAEAPSENAEGKTVSNQFADLLNIGVHRQFVSNIVDEMGYQTMTPVQEMTIKPALKGTDIVAQAKTGTGKTLAFLLPLLQRMINEDESLATRSAKYDARSDDIRGIVLSPTRELAEQIAEEARRLCRRTGLVVQSAVGGTQKSEMLRQTRRNGCHLLVATPGRLHDLLTDPTSGIAAPNLAALVLDEADRMLDVGFERELNQILDVLPDRSKKERQTMLVSATIPDKVIRLTREMVRHDNFEFVQTISESDSLTHDKVPQKAVSIAAVSNILPTVFELIHKAKIQSAEDPEKKPFKGIVYFNTTSMVQLAGEIGYQMRRRDPGSLRNYTIHSGLTQSGRSKAAEGFRRSESAVLFSSDVTARGMDFPDVTHVIQVEVPRDRETYIHRLGRTGRQGKDGEGWILVPLVQRRMMRNLLNDLPIKPDNSLECATYSMDSQEPRPKHMEEINSMYSSLSPEQLRAAYFTIFNLDRSIRDDVVEQMNDWVTNCWGWAKLPAVSRSFAQKCGMGNAALNFDKDGEQMENYAGRPSGRFGGGGGGGDAFDGMRSQIRDDSGRRGFGGRGGGGGFGGRGGGGGFGGRGGGGGGGFGGRGGRSGGFGGRGGGGGYGDRGSGRY